jgi:hypothetical protein
MLAATALALLVKVEWLSLIAGAMTVLLSLVVFGWPCPRCGNLYSVKLGFIVVAWPYSNTYMHCGSTLGVMGRDEHNGA